MAIAACFAFSAKLAAPYFGTFSTASTRSGSAKKEKTGSPSEGTLAAAPTAGGSRPCHFHGKDQYRDEAFASVASALRLTRQRVDGLRPAKHLQRREASSVCSRIALRYHRSRPTSYETISAFLRAPAATSPV